MSGLRSGNTPRASSSASSAGSSRGFSHDRPSVLVQGSHTSNTSGLSPQYMERSGSSGHASASASSSDDDQAPPPMLPGMLRVFTKTASLDEESEGGLHRATLMHSPRDGHVFSRGNTNNKHSPLSMRCPTSPYASNMPPSTASAALIGSSHLHDPSLHDPSLPHQQQQRMRLNSSRWTHAEDEKLRQLVQR